MTRDGRIDVVPEMAREGMTLREICDATGLGYSAVRGRLRRADVRPVYERQRGIRQIAEDMKPVDAVYYLLGIIEQFDLIVSEPHPVDEIGVHISDMPRRLLMALIEASPRYMSKDAIYNALYFDRASGDDLPSLKIIDVFVCKLRAVLPRDIGEIETVWGKGYRFVAAEVSK